LYFKPISVFYECILKVEGGGEKKSAGERRFQTMVEIISTLPYPFFLLLLTHLTGKVETFLRELKKWRHSKIREREITHSDVRF
jgi:hypothetical protein